MRNGVFKKRRERASLALLGKLDLGPLYAAMVLNLIISYTSSVAYGYLYDSRFVSWICEFGFQHIRAVRAAANLASNANDCAFVMTIQWLLAVTYLFVFITFLSPFSKIVRVAIDKAMRKEDATKDENKAVFGRIIILTFVPLVFLGDVGVIRIPTFLNGGLFVMGKNAPFVSYFLNSVEWMPLFVWVTVFGTFMFYWSWVHLAANYKTVFNL